MRSFINGKKYFNISTMMLTSSCTSVKNLEKESTCNVWKDQIIYGPTFVSVGNNKASWSGSCTCTPSEVLLGTLAVGVVERIQNDSAKKR
ncbi:MAG: hypothetical protein ACXVLQ_18180 [Bacteriovorax sp.]